MTHLTYCRCGHASDAHEHFRPGNDCGACRCGSFDGVSRLDASPTPRLATALLAVFAPPLRVIPRLP